MFTVYDFNGDFFLKAPLRTIERIFQLHPLAGKRILEETVDGKICKICFNDRYRFNMSEISVQKEEGMF